VTVIQVFYFGIIDFLQYYNAGKKAEHMFKSVVSNPLEIRYRRRKQKPRLCLACYNTPSLFLRVQCCGTEFLCAPLLGVRAAAAGLKCGSSFC
jgi:hypothetical protein